MTMPRLRDVASARLEVISFFLVGYLVLAAIYRWLWNSLAREFPKMPLVSYRGALAALVVCGLFVYVVLTMISGARELMTPGAWVRSGIVYRLRGPEDDPKGWLNVARRQAMERVRADLWRLASEHGGKFPTTGEVRELPQGLLRSMDPEGLPLVYVPWTKPDVGTDVVVHEPGSFGPRRLVLLSSGEIVELSALELTERLYKQIERSELER
jgi:hypothetical protein